MKKINKVLILLVIVSMLASSFMFMACNDKVNQTPSDKNTNSSNQDQQNKEGDSAEAQKQAAFSSLLALMKNDYTKVQNGISYVVEESSKQTVTLDFSESELPENIQPDVEEGIKIDMEDERVDRAEFAYKDNKAYCINSEKTGTDFTVNNKTLWFKEGDKHYLARHNTTTGDTIVKEVSENDDKCGITKKLAQNCGTIGEMAADIKEFSQLKPMLLEEIDESVQFEKDLIVDLIKTNDGYKFTISCKYKTSEVGVPLVCEIIEEILFTETKIISAYRKVTMTADYVLDDSDYDATYAGKIKAKMNMLMETKLLPGEGFDENNMETIDLATYEPIKKLEINITRKINGHQFDNISKTYDVGFDPNAAENKDFTWYLDEACTQKIENTIYCKSYEEITVYSKVETVPADKAEIVTEYPYDSMIEYWPASGYVNLASYYDAYVRINDGEEYLATGNVVIELGNRYHIRYVEKE